MQIGAFYYFCAIFFLFRLFFGSGEKEKIYYLIYVFMALSTWIKGPAGFLIPLIVIPVFCLFKKTLENSKI